YYHYCEIDASTVRGLQTASSKGQYFGSNAMVQRL
ncbi:MAG: KTSC domain-containing protein, partial [Rickettsiales bacterium]